MARHLTALLFALALTGCADKPSSSDCEKLLDHMVELEMAAAGTEGATPEQEKDLESQQKELKTAIKGEFMEQCTERTPSGFVSCALKTKSLGDLGKCDGPQ